MLRGQACPECRRHELFVAQRLERIHTARPIHRKETAASATSASTTGTPAKISVFLGYIELAEGLRGL
jgi:hypothetical protein